MPPPSPARPSETPTPSSSLAPQLAVVESWDGRSWTFDTITNQSYAGLSAVSCPIATWCMAVGFDGAALTEVWNGSIWSAVPTPIPPVRAPCRASRVPARRSVAPSVTPLRCRVRRTSRSSESWNGADWSIVPTPSASSFYNVLRGVSCGAVQLCSSAGLWYGVSASNPNQPDTPNETLAETTAGQVLGGKVVGIAVDPTTGGNRPASSDGGINAHNARFLGAIGGLPLNEPVVGMRDAQGGQGYWEVASDGKGFFLLIGDARFYGSTGGIRLNQPVVGMASTPSGGGYWLVAADGGLLLWRF